MSSRGELVQVAPVAPTPINALISTIFTCVVFLETVKTIHQFTTKNIALQKLFLKIVMVCL